MFLVSSSLDFQSGWSLLVHCVVSWTISSVLYTSWVRSSPVQKMGIVEDVCEATARQAASLPHASGGLGLRSARKTHLSAFWASWFDSLHMVQKFDIPFWRC